MLLGRIDGSIVATAAHPSLRGFRQVIVQPLDGEGGDSGTPVVAIDPLGAGLHQTVVLSSDGATTRQLVRDPYSPLRYFVVGIADT